MLGTTSVQDSTSRSISKTLNRGVMSSLLGVYEAYFRLILKDPFIQRTQQHTGVLEIVF